MKLGLIVFANDSGLGAQTRRLAYMLKPFRILAIDSTPFSKNKKQHFDWYSQLSGYEVNGFPNDREVRIFLRGLTHVFVCENPLNPNFFQIAKQMGVKVFLQTNYEFCDHLDKNLTNPYLFLMPSYWKIKEMQDRFGQIVEYLPPPIILDEFKNSREINMGRIGMPRFLHIVGTLAVNDRNGTLDLLKSLKYAKQDFELVIRSQHELPKEYISNDKRVKYIIENEPDQQKMYQDFDALILPRRYGGLSLTCNEALMSGMVVIMTDISPNNELLPKDWLVKSRKLGEFKTRAMIDLYSAVHKELGKKIDWLCKQDLNKSKLDAFEIGYNNFSDSVLRKKYEKLFI